MKKLPLYWMKCCHGCKYNHHDKLKNIDCLPANDCDLKTIIPGLFYVVHLCRKKYWEEEV